MKNFIITQLHSTNITPCAANAMQPISLNPWEYLYSLGFSLIPLAAGGKKPLIKWTEYQTKKPSWSQIEQWQMEYPEANIGIVTGTVSGIFVVDFDSHEAFQAAQDRGLGGGHDGALAVRRLPGGLRARAGRAPARTRLHTLPRKRVRARPQTSHVRRGTIADANKDTAYDGVHVKSRLCKSDLALKVTVHRSARPPPCTTLHRPDVSPGRRTSIKSPDLRTVSKGSRSLAGKGQGQSSPLNRARTISVDAWSPKR